MEQKDYLVREIERIGLIISAIRQKLFGGKENLATTIEKRMDAVTEMLFNEINFDLDKFLVLDMEESRNYVDKFEGFNAENIERLAECIAQIGFNYESDKSKNYLEKALHLYELSASKSKTYSFERERNITTIKNML